jgi:hypothetical protein
VRAELSADADGHGDGSDSSRLAGPVHAASRAPRRRSTAKTWSCLSASAARTESTAPEGRPGGRRTRAAREEARTRRRRGRFDAGAPHDGPSGPDEDVVTRSRGKPTAASSGWIRQGSKGGTCWGSPGSATVTHPAADDPCDRTIEPPLRLRCFPTAVRSRERPRSGALSHGGGKRYRNRESEAHPRVGLRNRHQMEVT